MASSAAVDLTQKDKEKEHSERARPQRNDDVLDRSMVRWTRVVGVFTCVLAIVGGVQAWAFIQSERAYLTVVNPSFYGAATLLPNKQLVMIFNIKNSGKGAAAIRNLSITMKEDLPSPLEYDKLTEIASNAIVAGATEPYIYNGLNKDGSPFITSDATAKGVAAGDIKLFTYGYVDYVDDFSVLGERRSYFCYLYVPKLSTPNTAAFNSCPISHH